MSHAKNKVTWCLNKAKKEGEKHRGLIQITPDIGKARDHVAKAEHNLNVTFIFRKVGIQIGAQVRYSIQYTIAFLLFWQNSDTKAEIKNVLLL